jgi:hypothetical protein
VKRFPALPIPNFVLFPGCTVSLQFGFPALQEQLEIARRNGGLLVVANGTRTSEGWLVPEVGCLAQLRSIKRTSHGLQAALAGIDRARILGENYQNARLFWTCEPMPSQRWTRKKLPELGGLPEQVREFRGNMPTELWLDIAAFHTPNLPIQEKTTLLAETDPTIRYYQLLESTREMKRARSVSLN